jgi:hypothetical protein
LSPLKQFVDILVGFEECFAVLLRKPFAEIFRE